MKVHYRFIGVLAVIAALCFFGAACSRQEPSSSKPESKTSVKAPEAGTSVSPAPETVVSGGQQRSPSAGAPADSPESRRAEIEEVHFDPASPITGDSLKAVVVASGVDKDKAVLSYRWKINGQMVQESASNVLEHSIKRGDFVEVEVSASGGSPAGKLVSRYTTLGNAPPELKLSSQNMGTDGAYEARLEATDPEHDSVSFSLQAGPPGMTIESVTGVIRWSAGADIEGTYSVQVSARDSEGSESLLNYQIKIKREIVGGT